MNDQTIELNRALLNMLSLSSSLTYKIAALEKENVEGVKPAITYFKNAREELQKGVDILKVVSMQPLLTTPNQET